MIFHNKDKGPRKIASRVLLLEVLYTYITSMHILSSSTSVECNSQRKQDTKCYALSSRVVEQVVGEEED